MAKLVFQLDSKPSFFESILVRPGGTLLLTRQDTNEFWEVDPISGSGNCIAKIPNVESLTGFTQISPDVYAVGAGSYRLANHEGTVPGSYSIWIVDLSDTPNSEPKIHLVTKIPEIGQLNGVATWDSETILIADSYHGKIYRANVTSGTYSICFEHETTTDPPDTPLKMSVNGIKVRQDTSGTSYIYYTNTTRLLFCRVPVDTNIRPIGAVEVLACGFVPAEHAVGTAFESISSSSQGNTAMPWFMPDDFCFSRNGDTAYIASHPTNMVFKTELEGSGGTSRIAGGLKEWDVASGTACALGVGEGGEEVLYVSTAGANELPIVGETEAAKVVAIGGLAGS
ncbi:unnamed protein product [Periconia digitata]|uniref:Uncharacterized protein n=1 Tax=Periconia digitata TaxID=1303443 RepID=A0A9W4UIY7_9PLEO|nr:unnamed protein product [Periconia digitata]